MKKVFFVLLLGCMSMMTFAQNDLESIKEVNFYGIDFTKVRTFGVSESGIEMRSYLNQINDLFITEKKKYDIEKYFGKKVLSIHLESTQKNNAAMDPEKMPSDSENNELSEKDMQSIINKISYKDNSATGLIFIGENLDKPNKKGSYQVVFFNEKTKKIIYSERVSGKARGFGVRNYWAGSILDFMKNWEKK